MLVSVPLSGLSFVNVVMDGLSNDVLGKSFRPLIGVIFCKPIIEVRKKRPQKKFPSPYRGYLL